jgi:hypothetical protein
MTMDDRELDRRLDGLTREIEADESLWPAIERRLRPSRRWPALAATAAALAIGVLVVSQSLDERTKPETRPGLAGEHAAPAGEITPEALAVSGVDGAQPVMQAWQDNQAAIEQLEQALQRDPDNPLLLEFLSEARLRQARLIQRGLFPPERSI